MLDETKFAHLTVPHSGTRYINHCVEQALGERVFNIPNLRTYNHTKDKQLGQTVLFCHIGEGWEPWINEVLDQEHIKSWVTVRSPIHTWGTNWGVAFNKPTETRFKYEKLGQLRDGYETLMRIAPRVDYIHRVEDPLVGLEGFLGFELNQHEQTYSTPSPMKTAIKNKDIKAIEQLCEGTDFWKAFHDYITPDIREFYEQLGYDIWWYNG